MMLVMYAVSCLSVIPNLLRPLYEIGPCSDWLLKHESSLLNKIYSCYIIGVAYALPVGVFCVLYGCVCCTLTLRKRSVNGVVGKVPAVISSAQKRLTVTSVVLTLIFVGAIGTHLTCYGLGE